MVSNVFAAARPSSSEVFRDTVLLFQAIRVRDADALAAILNRNPALASATEDWSEVEGFASKLGFSERATALIRAAGTGDVRLVRLLVEAGAPVADVCGCVDHENALMTAVNIGATEVVDYLLQAVRHPTAERSMDNPPPCTLPCTATGTISCPRCSQPGLTQLQQTSMAERLRTGPRSRPHAARRQSTAASCGPEFERSISFPLSGPALWSTFHPRTGSARCERSSASSTLSHQRSGG